MEAPLNSPSSRYPSAPTPDPFYWVTPRHLAGDDGVLADRICDTLAEAGWTSWTTARSTLLLLSANGLCGAEWIRTDNAFLLGELPVAWQISARSHRDSALAEWNAYFTPGTPYEAVADLLLAVQARTDPAVNYCGPEVVMSALTAMGWPRDFDQPETTAWDAGLSAGFTRGPLPPGIQDGDPRPDLMGWQAWAEPVLGAPYLWCATFSASTPHDLVASFASSIASPVPVRRRILPELAAGRLTFSLPG
ncbi:DUF317 domain-containing protein [Streptomyces antarcticus]|uniref:DUF317 domain-containing protein n=1 Tax=Streptomyces antarcticus TaxID=2996458 RepID=UPI00226D5D14|nr:MULTISPECIES: DUF317 domain-containing protein [unclassified Streptomyces]MCY0940198.1 DUF317 domain-containing protein [Streptomyces sp. H34-AA3]MCZ4080845.1 DUF317 domain-containing protein [Streptomyces sp. H34-S5]